MVFNRLKYYAKNTGKAPVRLMVKNDVQPSDRWILSYIYDHKPILIGKEKFYVHQVTAHPSKKTVIFEVLITVLIALLITSCGSQNNFILKCIFASFFAAIIGSLIGLIRIETQKHKANKFNKS